MAAPRQRTRSYGCAEARRGRRTRQVQTHRQPARAWAPFPGPLHTAWSAPPSPALVLTAIVSLTCHLAVAPRRRTGSSRKPGASRSVFPRRARHRRAARRRQGLRYKLVTPASANGVVAEQSASRSSTA